MTNLPNRTVYCRDNLEILRGINSNSVDLIYLDPPFNKGRKFNAPIGSIAEGAEFKDTWTDHDVKQEWRLEIQDQYPKLFNYLDNVDDFSNRSNQAYLTFMAVRLIECQRVLKPTGTIWYHCDHTMSHYVKILMDIVFGASNFRNNVVWCYSGGGVPKLDFARKHDELFRYSKSGKYTFNKQYVPYSKASRQLVEARGGVSIDGKARDLTRGAAMPDWWVDINSLQTWSPQRVGYPTQKPLELLQRIIKSATNEGDVVLDPFCGCATTLVAAHHLNRQWAGIDVSPKAFELVNARLNERGEGVDLFEPVAVNMELSIPIRTDIQVIKAELQTADERRRRSLAVDAKEAVWARDGGKCVECGATENLHYDHIIPFSKGGASTANNLQLLCAKHNLEKGNRRHS